MSFCIRYNIIYGTSILFCISVIMISCSRNYHAFKSQYGFRTESGVPNYGNLDYWAAHPDKLDPSDSIPMSLKTESSDTLVDIFFLHPTIYTMKKKQWGMNAPVDDDFLNAKTDYTSILYQASIFNQHSKIYAPRFREAHISAYFTKDTAAAMEAFELAYSDVKKSFEYYLKHFNNGRPVIIASHSQGSTHALRLLKEFFENKPLQEKLVVAYVAGMRIPEDYFVSLKSCTQPSQTGCYCGWRTLKKGYLPSYVKPENGASVVVNPLTWKTDGEYAPRKLNKGSVLYNFNKIVPATTDALVSHGVVWVRKPRFPWSFLFFTKNYHAGDFNLYYMNVRQNSKLRIESYFTNPPDE